MGICSSCLGLNRRASQSDPSDSSHLLGDPFQPHYGSISQGVPHGLPQPDPEEIRRQRDQLERICVQTSDKLIDVSQPIYAEEGSKMAGDLPRLFADRFVDPSALPDSRPSTASTIAEEDQDTWYRNVLGGVENQPTDWEGVNADGTSALTLSFDQVLGLDRKPPEQLAS